MRYLMPVLIFVFIFSCVHERKKNKKQLTIYAAASLADVVTEIADSFMLEQDADIRINFAASGILARQIEQGGSADIFLSANKTWVDYIHEKGMSKQVLPFAGNDLVLIAPLDKQLQSDNIDSLLLNSQGRIAIGDPGYVPVGKYAMQIIDFCQLNLTDKLLKCQNARAVLMMVELGEVDFGIVYETDALQSKKVKLVKEFPDESHQAVIYYQVLTSEKNMAKHFYDYLYSAKTKKILQKHSFKEG